MDNEPRNLLLESVQRTVASNAKLKREIAHRSSRIYLPTKGWPVYREAYLMGWDAQAARRVIERIIRGLYFTHYKVRLPNDVHADAYFMDEIPESAIPEFTKFFEGFAQNCSRGKIGNKNEFVYLFNKANDNDHGTFWTFIFYERLQVFGFTGSKWKIDRS